MEKAEPGHDWSHVQRVRRLALQIAEKEGADLQVVELAALLHDVNDRKIKRGTFRFSADDPDMEERVNEILDRIGYSGPSGKEESPSLEHAAVLDADRLDAIGAIGIARAFSYGGSDNRPMHDPGQPPDLSMDRERYRASRSTTVNHFHEKLLLLKDRMLTNTGRELAEDRHRFLENFLERFLDEWGPPHL
jgi:uncharacterized protein